MTSFPPPLTEETDQIHNKNAVPEVKTSQKWYNVALFIGTILLGAGLFGTIGLFQAYGALPNAAHWFSSAIGTIGHTPGSWSLWTMAAGGIVLGLTCISFGAIKKHSAKKQALIDSLRQFEVAATTEREGLSSVVNSTHKSDNPKEEESTGPRRDPAQDIAKEEHPRSASAASQLDLIPKTIEEKDTNPEKKLPISGIGDLTEKHEPEAPTPEETPAIFKTPVDLTVKSNPTLFDGTKKHPNAFLDKLKELGRKRDEKTFFDSFKEDFDAKDFFKEIGLQNGEFSIRAVFPEESEFVRKSQLIAQVDESKGTKSILNKNTLSYIVGVQSHDGQLLGTVQLPLQKMEFLAATLKRLGYHPMHLKVENIAE